MHLKKVIKWLHTYNEKYNLLKSKINGIYNDILKFLLLLSLGCWNWLKKYTKSFINLVAHISLAYLFGIIMKMADVNKINQLLSIYWSAGIFVICIVTIIFIKETITYSKSFGKVVKNFQKIYYVIGLTYIFTVASMNQRTLLSNLMLIILFIVGWVIFQVLSCEKKLKPVKVDDESDIAINSYEQLLPTRKEEFTSLYKTLNGITYNEPFALVLNGDWGTGKTSLLNVLLKKLKKDKNYTILIQPMILDSSEKLMAYFFRELQTLLNSNGIFTGKDSPFKKYFNVVFQTINTLNFNKGIEIDKLLENLGNQEKNDFRDIKERLEIDIQKFLSVNKDVNNTKIYIIIDDFDRVERETFISTLIFIKEIVNFNGVNLIFLLDEERLYTNEIVTRDYMDKFVNKKFQLSKIKYEEILNYFIKSLEDIKLQDEFTIDIGQKIMKNIVELVNELINDIAKQLTEIENKINTLKNDSNKNDFNGEQEKLISIKMEVEGNLQIIKDGLSNVRKTKKIIREIKELLNIIDQQVLNHINVKYNLVKIENIEKIITRVAIFKILFTEHVDKLVQRDDHFYNVMEDIKYKNKYYLLSDFFSNIFNISLMKETEIQIILNDFFNAIILNYSFESLHVNKQTTTRIILEKLDDSEKSLAINSMQEIREYLEVMRFNSYRVKSEIIKLRVEKLVKHIMNMYDNKTLTFINLFELLGQSHKNQLLETDAYLLELDHLTDRSVLLKRKSDQNVCISYVNELKDTFISRYSKDIYMILNIIKLPDSSYGDDIKIDFDHINNLEELVNMIKKYSNEDNWLISGTDFLLQWINKADEDIMKNFENKYQIDAFKLCKQNIIEFISFYQLIESIMDKLGVMKVDPNRLFKEKQTFKTNEELILYIKEFHHFIEESNTMDIDYLHTFNRVLSYLVSYSRTNLVNSEIKDKIINIYESIPFCEYDEKSEEKLIGHWCAFRLGQIFAHQKQLENLEERNV